MQEIPELGEMSVREFQALYLDKQMHHSSGWFADPTVSLDEAQAIKSKRIAAVLGIEPGMTVLDVGCSWGAFARWIAERGAIVTGITVDSEHAAHMPYTPGLKIAVKRWQDYTELVDRVACINALENFDERPKFFHSLRSWLNPGGRAVIWSVTADASIYRVPSVSDILNWATDAHLEVVGLTTGLAHHYANTMECFEFNLESVEIPSEYARVHERRIRSLKFYRTSRKLLESGRNDMIEVVLRRAD